MAYCQRCGNKNEDDAKFCNKCGASLTGPPPPFDRHREDKCEDEEGRGSLA